MHYHPLAARLEHALKEPLPGGDAHARVAPRPRRQWPPEFDLSTVRDAAALLLVFPVEERAYILLTVRAATLGRHGGQVSLPGGVLDAGETVEQAALREAHEEIGLEVADVRIAGRLTPVDIPVSGFRLHAVVATIDHRPRLAPSAREVAAILEVAVEELLDPGYFVSNVRERDGEPLVVPAFHIAGHEIWGATAMVLAEFLAVIVKGS